MDDFTGTVTVAGVDYVVVGTIEPSAPEPEPPSVPSGVELDYVENTLGTQVLTSETFGDDGSELYIQGNPVEYDGLTRICIEVYCAAVEPHFHNAIQFDLHEVSDSSTEYLGTLGTWGTGGTEHDITRSSFTAFARRFFTPTAGVHTYQIRMWKTGGTVNSVYTGAALEPEGLPAAIAYLPGYYRITREG